MPKISKKLKNIKEKFDFDKFYSFEEAIKLAKEVSYENFDATIDVAFKLNLDVRQAEQQLRGSISLPNGTGKKVRVLAVTDNPEQFELAKKNNADFVLSGSELTEKLNSGKFDFDIIVAEPKIMPLLGRFGKVLGPKGLMPNPKTGTVTPLVGNAVQEIKKGKANYRTDKNGVIHTIIGKKSMENDKLLQNIQIIFETIKKLKPSIVKGTYIQTLSLSTTMGPSIKIQLEKN